MLKKIIADKVFNLFSKIMVCLFLDYFTVWSWSFYTSKIGLVIRNINIGLQQLNWTMNESVNVNDTFSS